MFAYIAAATKIRLIIRYKQIYTQYLIVYIELFNKCIKVTTKYFTASPKHTPTTRVNWLSLKGDNSNKLKIAENPLVNLRKMCRC